MARIITFNEKEQKTWDEWVESRPKCIQELCSRFPPYNLYLLKSTNHRVTILSYSEDNTFTVWVGGKYNNILFDRQVFGIKPDDLEECALPLPSEQLGTILTEETDILDHIEYLKQLKAGEEWTDSK